MAKITEQDAATEVVFVKAKPSATRTWFARLLVVALLVSFGWNAWQYYQGRRYFAKLGSPAEQFHSGSQTASDRIALLRISGTISPPFTGRLLKQIKKAKDDSDVKGAILVVDSPGGFVADSHMIYNKLQELADEKPIYVAMKRIAASGGYYIAMGAGPKAKIFAEPTTWTGSIGVIIPRYNVADLAKEYGVEAEPITAGKFKDTMSPFRDMREDEQELWGEIIDDAYQRFVGVIEQNRPNLTREQTLELATGQIYTANQAKENGLVDEIGFIEDVIETMKSDLNLSDPRVVTYYSSPSLLETFTGYTQAKATDPLNALMDASVPRAMYLFAWPSGSEPYDAEQ